VNFPKKSLREHHEAETGVSEKGAGPCVVRSVEAGANLVKIVCCAHSPFHIVVSEDVVAVSKFGGVAVGLVGLSSFTSVDVGVRVEVDVVLALGWSVAQVVKAWRNVLSEATDSKGSHGPLKRSVILRAA